MTDEATERKKRPDHHGCIGLLAVGRLFWRQGMQSR
jgi:hypothetical protein